VALGFVVEHFNDALGDGRRVRKRHQLTAAVGEQLFGIPIRRRNDRLAGADRVRQGSRGNLRRIEIRRDVDVRRADEFDQLLQADESVVEENVAVHPERAGQSFELQAVKLTFVPLDVRMGDAEDDVDGLGIMHQDFGQRFDDVFESLVGREESEGQQNQLAFDAEAILVKAGIDEGDVGDAVRDQIDLLFGHAVDVAQEAGAALAHHHQPVGALDQFFHDAALIRIGLAQHGVQGGDDRHAQLAQQRQNVAARRAAEDAVFMLQANEVHVVAVEEISGASIGGGVALRDFEADARRIVVARFGVVDRQREARRVRVGGGDGFTQVGGEGRDAALPRHVIADEGDSLEGRLPRGIHHVFSSTAFGPCGR
jgi:hypothetical protein